MTEAFTAQFVRPVWERFVALALASGLIKAPLELDLATLDDALFVGQTMPWIDPAKEAQANEILERNCYKSGPEIIRARGGNPRETLTQQASWSREKAERLGVQNAARDMNSDATDQENNAENNTENANAA